MIRLASVGMLLAALLCVAGCATRVPPTRTLPEWVQNVYVPLFGNETSEPGIEELATRAAIEEFLIDGRLKVVQREDADLVVRCAIVDYYQKPAQFENDEFPESSQIAAAAKVLLFEPSDPRKPFADLGEATSAFRYTSDFRRTNLMLDVDARKEAMRNLGQAIVQTVINGYDAGKEKIIDQDLIPKTERIAPGQEKRSVSTRQLED